MQAFATSTKPYILSKTCSQYAPVASLLILSPIDLSAATSCRRLPLPPPPTSSAHVVCAASSSTAFTTLTFAPTLFTCAVTGALTNRLLGEEL
jgi:hypothetical protein